MSRFDRSALGGEIIWDEFADRNNQLAAMARNGRNGRGRLDGRFAKKVQAQLGILVVPAQQHALDRLGRRRPRLRVDRLAVRAGGFEHSRSDEKSDLKGYAPMIPG